MTISCVVVSDNELIRQTLASLLEVAQIETIPVPTLGELGSVLTRVPVCAILCDLATIVRSNQKSRQDLQGYSHLYPVAKFRITDGQVFILGDTLESFIAKSQSLGARTVRKEERSEKHVAVYLSPSEDFENAEPTITVNVSDKGMFIYSVKTWEVGQRVWLKNVGDDGAVSGIVRSAIPWGNNHFMPGIGIEIEAATRPAPVESDHP